MVDSHFTGRERHRAGLWDGESGAPARYRCWGGEVLVRLFVPRAAGRAARPRDTCGQRTAAGGIPFFRSK